MKIEVVYGDADKQTLLSCEVPENAKVKEVIIQSGILAACPELELDTLQLGIFSKKTSHDTSLKTGDRIEIYRPLKIDPKQARKLRAERSK
jgi:putative ubiquitin-RnfH superfamily antitoxin RatB of RatAB toxin-antitoxin module